MDELIYALPERPPKGLLKWTLEKFKDTELGGDYMLYRRESMEERSLFDLTNGFMGEISTKRHWGARCTCTVCGEEFDAGITKFGIVMYTGEDGLTYPGWCREGDEETISYMRGEHVQCPGCDAIVQVERASTWRDGFTKQLMVCSPETVGDSMALIYWMVSRTLEPTFGSFTESVEPWEAVVIGPKGGMTHYAHRDFCMYTSGQRDSWKKTKAFFDPDDRVYHDYGSVSNRKMGAVIYYQNVDTAGTTGEKTGLMDYLRDGGEIPTRYLRLWKEFRAVENLIKDGWTQTIDEILSRAGKVNIGRMVSKMLDVRESKPHRILHMTKEEYRNLKEPIERSELEVWGMCWTKGIEKCSFTEFDMAFHATGPSLERCIERTNQGLPDYGIREIMKYAKKERFENYPKSFVINQLVDYRKMMMDCGIPMNTPEELWPQDIVAAHDRAAEMVQAAKKTAQQKDFDAVRQRLSGLEWTDGELCIRIPKSDGELVKEGSTLRHCVGGYGKEHSKGQRVILFVRHYRRPERSYYTLNEDITGAYVHRIQLHGYGNERHGIHKEKSHAIPPKVTAFVSRWETEVLAPWLSGQRKIKEASA